MNQIIRHKTDATEPACIWMQAGVIPKKTCFQDYNCTACRFDRALRRTCRQNRELKEQGLSPQGKRGRFIYWKDQLKRLPKSKQPCIHHMKGCISFRACYRDYKCTSCEFDQYFFDQYSVYTVMKPVDFMNIHGIRLPSGYYFHPGHTWARIENSGDVRIGIDDFALKLLGPLDAVRAPLMGTEIKQGRAGITVFRDGHEASFISPVTGVVTAVNPQPGTRRDSAGSDPYTEGWIMLAHCRNLKEDLKQLLFMKETETFMVKEVDELFELLEQTTGLMAADGGHLGYDIFGNAPALSWKVLTDRFIRKAV